MNRSLLFSVRKIGKLILIRWVFLLFLLPYLIWTGMVYQDFGVAIDEPIEYRFGELLYSRHFGKDLQLMQDFAVQGQHSREIWAYNHFHAMVLYIFNDFGTIERYHLLNLIFALVAFYVVYELVFQATKRRYFSLLGPFLLFFTPRYLGDVPANVKDPVFATYYISALLMIALAPKIKNYYLKICLIGVMIGLSAAARIVGYGLLIIYLVALIFDDINTVMLTNGAKSFFLWLGRSMISVGLVAFIAVIVHGAQMPYVAVNPPENLLHLMQIGQDYPWRGRMLYLGQMIEAGQLPWHYLPVWIGVTTPITVICCWLLSHLFIKNRIVAILSFAIWFNLLLYFLVKPNIYDGMRHYLFVVVMMAVLAAISIVKLLIKENRILRAAILTFVLIFAVGIGKQYLQLHPYQYLYFNQSLGGLRGAVSRFETDYWGLSFKEAANWLTEHDADHQQYRVGLCGNQEAKIYFNDNYHVTWLPNCDYVHPTDLDVIIAMGRNHDWDKPRGEIIYSVKRQNVPLVKVFKLE